MASATINPTRMELNRLKGRLKTATRGHKLLKDKRDELMKQFLEIVRRNRVLRKKVEEGLERANAAFTVASALMSPEMLEQALLYPKQSVELDAALEALSNVFHDMLELAEVEKTMQLLAEDIEKTRRRVNALEYVMIPGFQEKIRYISMKLDENERGNITRLMKVKDMVLQEAHDFQQPANA